MVSVHSILKLVLPTVASSLSAWFMLDWWLKTAPKLGFVGKDMNKPGNVVAVEAGGLWVLLASVFGIMFYIAVDTYTEEGGGTVPLLAVCLTALLAGLLGFVDDVLGWKKGVSPVKRVLLTIPIALPLVVVKAGHTTVELPVFGVLELGHAYSLLLVPVGIVGASNAFNMIAGYNGLEALQSIVLFVFVSALMVLKGDYEFLYVTLPLLLSILVFYALYNKYPAKIFPGNSFTYGIGALYASVAIYWNFEKYALLSFALYFAELVLFVRGLLNGVYKENFGLVNPDGSLEPPYDKSYSVTHVAIRVVKYIRGKCYEVDVVKFVVLLQVITCALAFLFTVTF